MPDIKVRVGQTNAVKVVASAFGGSLTAENAQNAINVIGGIASVTQIYNTGITTFLSNLYVAGITTLAANGGITTTGGSLYVGNELNVPTLRVSGMATFGDESVTIDGDNDLINIGSGVTIGSVEGVSTPTLNVSGISTFWGNVGIGTADPTVRVESSNTAVLAVGILTAHQLYSGGGGVIIGDDITTRNFKATGISTFHDLVKVEDFTLSSSRTSGALVISGGVGIGSNLYVGTKINANNLDLGTTLNVSGISTFEGRIDANSDLDINGQLLVTGITTYLGSTNEYTGRIIGAAVGNILPFLYTNFSDLPSPSTYHGAFAHVHERGKAYFAHSSNWWELVNKELNGTIGVGTERYNIGPVDATTLNITGIATFGSNVSIGGTLTYEDVTNIDSVGLITARTGLRITTGGLIVNAGVSTFGAIATFSNNVFVDGTLTAGLIDGGSF